MMARGHGEPRVGAVPFLLLALMLSVAPARAALFDDDEARKRIELVRQRVDQIEQRLTSLEATLRSQGLVDLLREVEQVKADIATLRGQQEVLTYELEQAQKRSRDLYLDLDGRLRKLEAAAGGPAAPAASEGGSTGPGAANLPGAPARSPSGAADLAGEQRAYDAAFDQFKNGSYPAAIASFQSFVRTYPRSPLAASAMYWQGNAQYAQRDFRGAIATQRQLLSTYPDSQKVPDALLNIATCQTEIGENTAARKTLEDLVTRFPTSEAAGKAKQRLGRR